jgi:hypothetical protein
VRRLRYFLAVLPLIGCGASDSTGVSLPPPPPTQLAIDVRYLSELSAQQQAVVTAAADKWMHALVIDLGAFQLSSPSGECFADEPALRETHDNLLLFVSVASIDGQHGVIAYTQICQQSAKDSLPTVSHIRIDADDIDSIEVKGLLPSIVTHEMAHALGFNPQVYAQKGLVEGSVSDPYFTGSTARTEFGQKIPGYGGNSVPLENLDQLGTQSSHWRWSVFGDELMISSILPGYRYPLSTITLGLFRDIGYNVNMSAADPYPIYSIMAGPTGELRIPLGNDIVAARTSRIVTPVRR